MNRLFEAVVFRFVPDEGSGEVLNVGLAMRTEDGAFFRVKLTDSWTRVTDAFPSAHAPTVRAAFARIRDALDRRVICQTDLPQATTLQAELELLVPSPDGALKWSTTIDGVTDDPEQTFARLMHRYVEQHLQQRPERESRSDEDVKAAFQLALEKRGNLGLRLHPRKLVSKKRKHFEVNVEHAWKNGLWNCVQPVSLDLLDSHAISLKAAQLAGNVRIVAPSQQGAQLVLLIGVPPTSRRDAYEAAQEAIAAVQDQVADEAVVYLEERADELLDRVETDLALH